MGAVDLNANEATERGAVCFVGERKKYNEGAKRDGLARDCFVVISGYSGSKRNGKNGAERDALNGVAGRLTLRGKALQHQVRLTRLPNDLHSRHGTTVLIAARNRSRRVG